MSSNDDVLDRINAFIELCEKSIEIQRAVPRGWTRDPGYQEVKKAILDALPQIEVLAQAFHPPVLELLRKSDAALMHENKLEAAIELRGAVKSRSDTAELIERFQTEHPAEPAEAEVVEIEDTDGRPGLRPVESEFEVGFDVGMPDWGPHWPTARAHVAYRRLSKANDLVANVAELTATSVGDVIGRLDGDGAEAIILESALEGAMRTADRRKIQSLARVAANALAGDDAAVRISSLVLPEVLLLEAHHVAVLVDVSKRGPGQHAPFVGGTVHTGPRQGDDGTVEAILAQLNGRGLIANDAGAVTIGPPQSSYYLTQLGHTVLRFLVDLPELPENRE